MARISIPNEVEFSMLLNELNSDVGHAYFHYNLLRALLDAHDQYWEVLAQTRTFWFLTIEGHQYAILFRLSRIFDQHRNALSLGNWLQTIKANLYLFDEPNFRTRLKDNPFVECLAKDSRKPDEQELDRDIASVVVGLKRGADSVVENFVGVRNKYLAHKDPAVFLPSMGPEMVAGLSWDDVEHLLNLAHGLLSKYSLLFRASVDSTSMLGQDDYKYIVETIDSRLKSQKADLEAEIQKYLKKPDEEK